MTTEQQNALNEIGEILSTQGPVGESNWLGLIMKLLPLLATLFPGADIVLKFLPILQAILSLFGGKKAFEVIRVLAES